jgi:hypothetical protein
MSIYAIHLGRTFIGRTILHVSLIGAPLLSLSDFHWDGISRLDYEQQRIHLLHKHGIDLEDPNGLADGTKTKRMKRRDIENIMGGGDKSGGIFTWREKNKRKVGRCYFLDHHRH